MPEQFDITIDTTVEHEVAAGGGDTSSPLAGMSGPGGTFSASVATHAGNAPQQQAPAAGGSGATQAVAGGGALVVLGGGDAGTAGIEKLSPNDVIAQEVRDYYARQQYQEANAKSAQPAAQPAVSSSSTWIAQSDSARRRRRLR